MKNATITLAAAAAAGLLTVTAAPALAGGHGNKPAKVCHKPGTPAEKTLKVPSSAVSGHLGHGDYLGACVPAVEPEPEPEPEPTEEPTEEPTTTPPTNWNWEYDVTCAGISGTNPNGPIDSVDSNVRIKNLTTNETRTFNYHPNTGGPASFNWTFSGEFKVPADWTNYEVQWVQVNGTNYHWEGSLKCGEPVTQPTTEPTTVPTTTPTTEPTEEPEQPEPTTEPTTTPTTEPTEEPEQPEPTTEPTTEPTVEPEPVAVVALPKLPTGSLWHDCEIGWTYDLDAQWDAEFTHIWIVDPNGRNLGEGDDGTRVSGVHEIHVGVTPGKTYHGIPVVGLDMTPDWTPVEGENGYVTHAYRTFTVALPDPRDCGTQIGTPRATADTPDADAADTTATSDTTNTTTPTTKHLANTGGRHAGWSIAGVLTIAAGLILIARGRWAK